MNPFSLATTVALVSIVLGTCGGSAAQQASTAPASSPSQPAQIQIPVRLGVVPQITLAPRPAIGPARAAQIKKLISELATIQSPDYGLSPTMSGDQFLPVAGQETAGMFLLTDHQLKPSPALKALVEMGPDSLSFLLAALDDQTPTKLKIDHDWGDGAMWFANELWGNPANPVEFKVLDMLKPRAAGGMEKNITSYTVKVGDVCLVAIGQITGRGYHAVRYQPSHCIVINSATADVTVRDQVRQIWSSDSSPKHLLDSLLIDYGTTAAPERADSMNNWYAASAFQTRAVLRLLYYFPKESAPLIARRLEALRIENTGAGSGEPRNEQQFKAWQQRELANAARTDELVKAAAWCEEPAIRNAGRSIFERTNDVDILLAALPALEEQDRELIQGRLTSFLVRVPQETRGPFGDGYRLLLAAAKTLHAAARPMFLRYLEDAGPVRRYAVCEGVAESDVRFAIDVLRPLLDDKRPVGGYAHPASKNDRENSVQIRVCDAAAEAISKHHPRLNFMMIGTDQELDQQIQMIREQLARQPIAN